MGSSQGRPSHPADAAKELRGGNQQNTSARDASVKLSPAGSDAAIAPSASDITTERHPSASDAALGPCPSAADATKASCPSALDATVVACPSAEDADKDLCQSTTDAAIATCPSASDAVVQSCLSAQDTAGEPCPCATDASIGSCSSASDDVIESSASDVTIEPCPSASNVTIGSCPSALVGASGQCPSASDAAPEVPQPDANDLERANRRRWAKVRLYTHALCGMGAAGAAASLSLPVVLHCVSSQVLKHWCLIVRFLDEEDRDRVWLCDFGNALSFKLACAGAWHPRKGERINYMARPVSKQALRKGKMMERKFYLGTIQISEKELQAACSGMRHNGRKYHPLARNCQHCSKDLCRRLGLSASGANDHLIVFLCPPLALLTELAGSAYNAANKFVATKTNK